MIVTPLKTPFGNPAQNQFVMEDDTMTMFQSYESLIATVDKITGKITVYPKWEYSRTTMCYFKQFMTEFTNFPYETAGKFRKLLEKNRPASIVVSGVDYEL